MNTVRTRVFLSGQRAAVALACMLAMAAPVTQAAENPKAVLVQGQGVSITVQDVLGAAQNIPPEQRAQVLGQPSLVRQMAGDLLMNRILAQQAQKQGLQRDPALVAALQQARDRVLATARMVELDAQSRPSAQAAEAQAHSIYLAQPERFQTKTPEVHASHILISGKDDAARAKAQALLHRLQQGADFAELARQESADLSSAARGGDLGFFPRGKMVREFENAAFALQNPGDLSEVVESGFGLHIIRLHERREAVKKPFEEVREELIAEVQAGAVQKAREVLAVEIRDKARFDDAALQALAATYEAQARASK